MTGFTIHTTDVAEVIRETLRAEVDNPRDLSVVRESEKKFSVDLPDDASISGSKLLSLRKGVTCVKKDLKYTVSFHELRTGPPTELVFGVNAEKQL
jgi:hypothetical protein